MNKPFASLQNKCARTSALKVPLMKTSSRQTTVNGPCLSWPVAMSSRQRRFRHSFLIEIVVLSATALGFVSSLSFAHDTAGPSGPPSTFRGGRKDDLASPTDPTARSARLNSALPTVTWNDFDDTTIDRFVGHTFSNLSANIVSAELIIRMKPLGSASNDSLHLGLMSASPPATWAWQLNIRNLPGANGTWNSGVNPATTFTLDLGNLPTGGSIITKLATDRYLDLMAQDDTELDFVELRVWTSPPQNYFFGLNHTALGMANLKTDKDGNLVVSNIGNSGQDGVAISLGDSQEFSFTSLLDPGGMPIGAYAASVFTGTVNGIPNQPLGGTKITRDSDGFDFEHEFFAGSGPTYTIQVFNQRNLVYAREFAIQTGPALDPLVTPLWRWLALVGIKGICTGSTSTTVTSQGTTTTTTYKYSVSLGSVAAVIEGGDSSDSVTGDLFQLTFRSPGSSILTNSVNLVAAGMSEMPIFDEAVGLFDVSLQTRGSATLLPQAGFLSVNNLGPSGNDGVTIGFDRVHSFDVGLDPIVDRQGNPLQSIGAYLEATAIGSLNGVPGQSLGVARITQAGANSYAITADFTSIGSSTQHLQVFSEGVLVADFPNHSGPVGAASAWMRGIGKLGGLLECFVLRWLGPTSFVISGANGTSYVGDELRILAVGATEHIDYKSGLQLLTAEIPEITVVEAQARRATLGNIATRLRVEAGDGVMIAGFIVQGGGTPKQVIIRAIGPSLTRFGIPNPLADPALELHGPAGFATITNNNWREAHEAELIATGIPPTDDLESAIVATLEPGAYTAIVRGVNGGTGVGIAELYDLNPTSGSLLANISTRGFVQTGDNIMIGGFIVVTQATRTIIRAIAPSLTQFGVPDALANPTLELRDSNGALLIANNDWQDDPAQAAELTAAGLAPTNALEAGIATTLPPGPYTALLAGVNNTTGNALVEVYALP